MAKHCTTKPKVRRGNKPQKADFVDQLKVLQQQMYQGIDAVTSEDIENDSDYHTILNICKTLDKDILNAFGDIAFKHIEFKNKVEAEVIHGKANAISLWFLSEREVRNPRIGVADSPLYGDLSISSVLASIYDDIDFIYEPHVARRLKNAILTLNSKLPNGKAFDKVFNPNSTNMDAFDESDSRHVVKLLVRTYLKNKEILDSNKNYRDFKKALIQELSKSIDEAKGKVFKTAFNEKHVKSLLDELNSKNSYLYNTFLKYLRNNYGIDRFKFNTVKVEVDNKSIDELENDNVEEVINKWDEDAKLKLDLKSSLSYRAKLFIAREIALDLESNSRANKFYLNDPIDINTLWNQLVNAYSTCRTIQDYVSKTRAIVKTQPHLQPLQDVFDNAVKPGASINEISMAKTIMTAVGSLSKTPVQILSVQEGVGQLFDQNRDSFPEKLAIDAIEDSLYRFDKLDGFKHFSLDSDLYKDFVKQVKTLNASLGKQDYNIIAEEQIKLLNRLHIPVSLSSLKIHYSMSEDNANDIVNKAKAINNTISNIANIIARNERTNGKYDISGWLYDLACIDACDFNAKSSFTYLDVKGELNYTPQYDSFLTRFTRGWIVNGVVDSNRVYESFKPYLEDPTINFGNTNHPLFKHGAKYIRGLFEKINGKWELTADAKNAIKSGNLFKISQFNGIKVDEIGYKYQQDQGDLFAYTLFILAAHNQFLLLTSDSPRSYTMSYQPSSVEDLFIIEDRKLKFESREVNGHKIDFIADDMMLTNFAINTDSDIFSELKHIVYSDINKLKTIGSKLLQDFPIDKYNNKTWGEFTDADKRKLFKYHNVKYWDGSSTSRLNKPVIYSNGKFVGRSLQCLNLSYVENDKTVTLLDYINTHYPEVNIMDNINNLDAIVTDFVQSYIRNVIDVQLPKTQGIANELFETVSSIRNISTFDTSMLQADVENVYNELLEELSNSWDATHKISWEEYSTNSKYRNSYKNKLAEIRQNAESKVTSQKDVYTSDGYRKFVLEAILNRTIQSHFAAEIFQGDIEEYLGTVDYNKRIAQTIKNGLNSADAINDTESNVRKVLVVEDWIFGSNIVSKLFNDKGGINNEALRKAHNKSEKVNDSQSFITDKGLEELLKATGRWHEDEPLYQYITNLRNNDGKFDPNEYGKLVEQLKLFATARRTRGEFLPIYGDDVTLGAEVDSIQIKDSTIVMFKTMVAGSDLELLYDEMVNKGIHQISPISAVKVSGVTPYRIHDENGAFIKGSLSNEQAYKHAVLNMRHSDFVIQQDIPADMLDEKIILGNQLIKQMMEGLNWTEAIYTLDGKAVTGKEIFDEFQNILATNIEEDFLKLFFDIVKVDNKGYIQLNPNGTITVDTVKLTQLFQEHVARDTQSANIRKMLKLGENENIEDNISLSNPLIYTALQNVITSTFTKAVANKYMSGFHAPIRADIMTVDGRLISHKELYKTPEHYNEIIDEFTQNGAITWSQSFIDRCKAEGRPLTLRAEYRNENGKDVYYAEVITSAWNSDFFHNIGVEKVVNGKRIQTIDLDKLSPEARQMLGIRIPTEGKQSMVVFEVVGILNTGATQAIFPQTLVNRTGWDFDIDSIYAYYRNVKFNEDIYTPIEFNTNFEVETEQKRHNFGSSLLESEIRKIELNAYSNREDLGNILTLRKDIVTNIESFRKHIDSVLESLVFTENESKVISLKKIKDLLKKFESAHDFYYRNQVAFNKFDVDTNNFNFTSSTIKDKHSMTKPLHSAIVNMIQHLNDIESLIENNELTELSDDFANLNNFENYTSYSNTLKTNIAKIQKAKADLQIKKSKNEITESVAQTKEVEIAQKEANIQSLIDWYDNISDLTISEFLSNFIDAIDINISSLNEQINTNVIGSTDNVYKSNSRDARDNRLLDIMIEVHTNPYHAEAVNTPNAMDELIYISDVINGIYNFDINKLNPHDMFDAITLNNMSMGSTILKGHSVNFDSFLAVLSTLNGRLAEAIRHPVHVEDLPIPEGWTKDDVYKKTAKGYILTNQYKEFLDDRLGYTEKEKETELGVKKERKHRFKFLADRGVIIFQDVWINNDANNEHLDITGGQIGAQMKQFTTAILDILKSNLGFNINTDTLSIARVLAMGCITETFLNKDGVAVNNRYAYPMLFVHQPVIVDIVNNLNRSKIVNPHYNIDNSFNRIYSDLVNDILHDYLEVAKIDPTYKLPQQLHEKLIDLSKNGHNIKSDTIKYQISNESDKKVSVNDLIDNIAELSGSQIKITAATQTSRDLKQNMLNRNATDPVDKLKHKISQLNVLHLFDNYKSITDQVVNLQFILKTEGKLKSFYNVDNKNKQLVDYYYSDKSLIDELGEHYKASLNSIDINDPQASQKLNDFYTKTSQEYVNIWGEQDDTFITFTDWKQAKYEIYQANDLASKTKFVTKYNLISTKNSVVILPDGSDIIDAVFPQAFESYINDDGTFNLSDDSVYKVIQSRFLKGAGMVHRLFDSVFILRNPLVRGELQSQLYAHNRYVSDDNLKRLNDAIINEFVNLNLFGTNNIVLPEHTDAYKLILGLEEGTEEQIQNFKDRQASIVKELSKLDLTVCSEQEFGTAFHKYTQLTLANQIDVLNNNPVLSTYINRDPIFSNHNVFKYVRVLDNADKLGYQNIILQVKEDDTDISNAITNSIAYMWNSNNPFAAHTIRQLIMHTYITKGIRYGFNIGKYLPTELLSKPMVNDNYNKLCDEYKLTDVSENLHNYTTNLIHINNLLNQVECPIDVKEIVKKAISKSQNLVHRAYNLSEQQFIWSKNPFTATMGYIVGQRIDEIVTNEDGSKTIKYGKADQLAIKGYTDGNGVARRIFFETELRLVASRYCNSELVSAYDKAIHRRVVYRKVLATPNEFLPERKIYAFIPVERSLVNEANISKDSTSVINKYDNANKVQIAEKIGDQEVTKLIDIEDFIQTLDLQFDEIRQAITDASEGKTFIIEPSDTAPQEDSNQTEQDTRDGEPQEDETNQDAVDLNTDMTDGNVHQTYNLTEIPIRNIVSQKGSLTQAINDAITSADSSVYITRSGRQTHTPTGSINIIKGYHQNAIQVDYTKSPKEEALRIAKDIKKGELYINGDLLEHTDKSFQDIYFWTQAFMSNLKMVAPQIDKVTTIINNGFGEAIARSSINAERNNINIYEDEATLYSDVLVHDPTLNPIENAFINNGNIAIELMSNIRKISRFFAKNNFDITKSFHDLIKKFEDIEEVEYNLETSIRENDRIVITKTYDTMIEIASSIMHVCEQYEQILRNLNYEEIRNNYNLVQDYKRHLNELLNLLGHFNKYAQLQEIDINNTIYDPDNEEDVAKFKSEFGSINKSVKKLQSLYLKSRTMQNFALDGVKRTIIWRVIEDSRNPKYTTHFSKLLEYLEAHDYDISGIQPSDLEISAEEWLEMEHAIFALNKDITKYSALLDSGMVTGNTLVDMLGKAYTQANDEAVEYSHKRLRELENILESYQKGLFSNRSAREAFMHELVDEYGNFISTYNTVGLSSKIYVLKSEIKTLIAESFNTPTGERNDEIINKLQDDIKARIEKFNDDNELYDLEVLSIDEVAKHNDELNYLNSRQKFIYLQTNHLVEIPTGDNHKVLYKVNFAESAKSEAFKRLSPEKQKVLADIKALTNRIIQDHIPGWTNKYGAYDSFVPYIPKATIGNALKGYISVPRIHHDKTYETIGGLKRYSLSAETLKVPRVYHEFKLEGVNAKTFGETQVMYEARMVEAFNEWRLKHDTLGISKEAVEFKDITNFNEQIKVENSKHKAKTMSYDIVDVMTGFVQEMANLQSINNWYLDYDLARTILNKDTGNGSPMSNLKNLAKQVNSMEERIVDVSKIHSTLDQLAGGLLRFTSVSFMYLNYTAGITNIIKGVTDALTYTSTEGLIGGKELVTKGFNEIMKAVIPYLQDVDSLKTDNMDVAIIKHFDAIYQDTRDVTSSLTASGMWTRILQHADKYGYGFNSMGEFIMQYGMLLACTESHRIVGGKIMAFQDFYRTKLSEKLMPLLNEEQKREYERFVENLDNEIRKEENRSKVEYMWDHDYASAYIKTHLNQFDRETREKLVDAIEKTRKTAKEAFAKYPTLKSQFELQDGQLAMKEESGVSKTEVSNFRSRVKSINQSLHGIYDRVNRNALQDNAYGNLLMQFRKWVVPNWNRLWGRRFGHTFYNEQLGAYETPVFNTAFDIHRAGKQAYKDSLGDDKTIIGYAKAVCNYFKGVLSFIGNIRFYYNTLPAHERVAAVQFAKLMGAIAFAFVTAALLSGLRSDDDDENENNKLYTHTLYIATSWYQEMVGLVPPFGLFATVKQFSDSAFAGEKAMLNAGKLIGLLTKMTYADEEDMRYDRGVYKGEHKAWVTFKQLMPVMRQINKYQHLGQTMSWYRMYNFVGNPDDILFNVANQFTKTVFNTPIIDEDDDE